MLAGTLAAAEGVRADYPDVHIPDGYEQYREPNLYVRFGDGEEELRRTLPSQEFDASFLKDWFSDRVVAVLAVSSISLPAHVGTDKEAYAFLASGLEKQWGKHSFSVYDDGSGIGRFVNYAGAFVAVSWREVGEDIVIVEAQDLVEVLVVETLPPPESRDPATLWQHYRAAANADDVDAVLAKPMGEP